MLKTTLIIIALLLALPLSAVDFATKYVQENYEQLPALIRAAIGERPKEGVSRFTSNELVAGSQVKLVATRHSQVIHIGFDLFKDHEIRPDERDVYYFLENTMLNLALQPSFAEMMKAAEKRSIVLLIDNNQISQSNNTSIPFSAVIKSSRLGIRCENGHYFCVWSLPANKSFSMSFPADLNIITGMDKGELELALMKAIKSFTAPNTLLYEYKDKGDTRLSNGMYIQQGGQWLDDNFRSDIYLTKKNATEYLPVFSLKFPAESFANLFLCNMPVAGIRLAITQSLYGDQQESYTISLLQLKVFLSQYTQSYFGMQDENATSLKATVIYYNTVYQYIHMLVVETDKATLFGSGEKTLQAIFYAYIPHHNYIQQLKK